MKKGLHIPVTYLLVVMVVLMLALFALLYTRTVLKELSAIQSQALKYAQQINELLRKESNVILIIKNKYTSDEVLETLKEDLSDLNVKVLIKDVSEVSETDISRASAVIVISSYFDPQKVVFSYPREFILVEPQKVPPDVKYTSGVDISNLHITSSQYLYIPIGLDNYDLFIELDPSTSGSVSIIYGAIKLEEYSDGSLTDLGPRLEIQNNQYNSIYIKKYIYGSSGFCTVYTLQSLTKSLPYDYSKQIVIKVRNDYAIYEVGGTQLLYIKDRPVQVSCPQSTGVKPYIFGGLAFTGENLYIRRIDIRVHPPFEGVNIGVLVPVFSTDSDVLFVPSIKTKQYDINTYRLLGGIVLSYDCPSTQLSRSYVSEVSVGTMRKEGVFPMLIYSPSIKYTPIANTPMGPALVVLHTTPPIICISSTLQNILTKVEMRVVLSEALKEAAKYTEIGYFTYGEWSSLVPLLTASRRVIVLTDALFTPFPDKTIAKKRRFVSIKILESVYRGVCSVPIIKGAKVLVGKECPLIQEYIYGTRWYIVPYYIIYNKEAFLATLAYIFKR